ncbi:MAG: hypothetical protein V2I43_10045 [Parvularcula sp.]|nr:hypothetical protein [Parvularcula sp.]
MVGLSVGIPDNQIMPIFRYFTKEEYARDLIENGQVRFCTLGTYHVFEDNEVRRDPSDGLLRYKPEGGVTINQGDRTFQNNMAFVSIVKVNDIYVYCMSNKLSEELATRFNSPFCVEIQHCLGFIGRIRRQVRLRSQLDHANVFARSIDYRVLDREPGADWALPERLAFIKPEPFEWQDEFRIVIGNKGALGVENVDTHLEADGRNLAVTYEERDPLVLQLGDISRFAALRKF